MASSNVQKYVCHEKRCRCDVNKEYALIESSTHNRPSLCRRPFTADRGRRCAIAWQQTCQWWQQQQQQQQDEAGCLSTVSLV